MQTPSYGNTGTPEPPRYIRAQFADMADPLTTRDAVFVGARTMAEIDVPAGVFVVESEAGTLYTRNLGKAAKYRKSPTDNVRAAILGYTETKQFVMSSGKPLCVVVTKNAQGDRIFEELTTVPRKVLAKQRQGGYEDVAIESPVVTQLVRHFELLAGDNVCHQ